MKVLSGCHRHTFLVGRYAIKIPQLTMGWWNFLLGLRGNINECNQGTGTNEAFCPVVWGSPLGLILVMLRAEPFNGYVPLGWFERRYKAAYVERKASSFGLLDGRIVAIDYDCWQDKMITETKL